MPISFSKVDQEFASFMVSQISEIRHPYSSLQPSHSFHDVEATTSLLISALRIDVGEAEYEELANNLLVAVKDYQNTPAGDLVRRTKELKTIATSFEIFTKKVAILLGFSTAVNEVKNQKKSIWRLLGPDALKIVNDLDVIRRLVQDRSEDMTHWVNLPAGDTVLYRARMTRNKVHVADRWADFELSQRFTEIVCAFLYVVEMKEAELLVVLQADEERRKSSGAEATFRAAINAWRTAQVPASKHQLDWFYEYRDRLTIDVDALVFLLISEMKDKSDAGIFSSLFRFKSPSAYLRWINLVDSTVCIQAIDEVLRLYDTNNADRDLAQDLVSYLCGASGLEVQKLLVTEFELLKGAKQLELFRQSYQASPLPSEEEILVYLVDLLMKDLDLSIRYPVVVRMMEYYRRSAFQPTVVQEHFPVHILENSTNRKAVSEYFKTAFHTAWQRQIVPSDRRQLQRYAVVLMKMLCKHDSGLTVATMREIVEGAPSLTSIEPEFLMLMHTYDSHTTIEMMKSALRNEKHYYDKATIKLLDVLYTPEFDDLLVQDLERYTRELSGGSKRWRGKIVPAWRIAIRNTISMVGKHRINTAVSYLGAIAAQYEPENLKLSCLAALSSIEGISGIPFFVQALEDGFPKIREKATKYLIKMHQYHDVTVRELVKSMREPAQPLSIARASHRDAMLTKIDLVAKLKAIEASEILEQIAKGDNYIDVREAAAHTLSVLRKVS